MQRSGEPVGVGTGTTAGGPYEQLFARLDDNSTDGPPRLSTEVCPRNPGNLCRGGVYTDLRALPVSSWRP